MARTSIPLPETLKEALRAGKLVVFAGSGLSVDPPSLMPLLEDFAKDAIDVMDLPSNVTELMGRSVTTDKLLQLAFNQSPTTFHERVKRTYEKDVPPNQLHYCVGLMFKGYGPPRIVTTNYDLLISKALRHLGFDDFRDYAYPTTMRDAHKSIDGVVYLHGSVRGRAKDLVVLKDDFGLAYFGSSDTPARATDFVRSALTDMHILFLGYGLNDTIFETLLRVLPNKNLMYSLCLHRESGRWADAGVTPLTYDNPGDDPPHRRLSEVLQDWVEQVQNKKIVWQDERTKPYPSLIPSDVVESGDTRESV